MRSRRPDTRGLLVVDHTDTQAKKLPKMIRSFQESGTRWWSRIDHVIEAPFFVDSSKCSGVQLADLCSYALRRCVERGETERLEMIFPRFYRSRGKLVGLRQFTASGCPCMICGERGHGAASESEA